MLSWDNFAKKKQNVGEERPIPQVTQIPPRLLLWQISYFSSLPETSGIPDKLCRNGMGKRNFFKKNLRFFNPKNTIKYVRKSIFAPQPFSQESKVFLLRAEIRLFVSSSRRGSLAWREPETKSLISARRRKPWILVEMAVAQKVLFHTYLIV